MGWKEDEERRKRLAEYMPDYDWDTSNTYGKNVSMPAPAAPKLTMPQSSTASFGTRKALNLTPVTEGVAPKPVDFSPMPGSNVDYWERGMPKTEANQNKPTGEVKELNLKTALNVLNKNIAKADKLPSQLLDAVMYPGRALAKKVMGDKYKPDALERAQQKYEDYYDKRAEDYVSKEEEENWNTGERIFYGTLGSLPSMLLGGLAGKALGAAGTGEELASGLFPKMVQGKEGLERVAQVGQQLKEMAPFGTIAGFQGLDQAEQENPNLTALQKAGIFASNAYFETTSEMAFMPEWFKKMVGSGGTDLMQQGSQVVAKSFGKKFIDYASKHFGMDLLKEGVQEAMVDPPENAAAKAIYKPDMKMFGKDGVVDPGQMAEDFAGGMLMSVMLGGFGLSEGSRGRQIAEDAVANDRPITEQEAEIIAEDIAQQNGQAAPVVKTYADVPGIGRVELADKPTPNTTNIIDPAGNVVEINDALLKNANIQQMQVPQEQLAKTEAAPEEAAKLSDDERLDIAVQKNEAVKAEYESGKMDYETYNKKIADIDRELYDEPQESDTSGTRASEEVRIPTAPGRSVENVSDELMSKNGQDLWNKIAATVKADNPNSKLELVKAKSGFQNHITKLMKQLGTEVVFYKGDTNVNGFVDPTISNTIFVKVNNERNELMQTAGHEFLHIVAKRHRNEYGALLNFARQYFTQEARQKYLEAFKGNEKLLKRYSENEDILLEEMLADELGNNFTNHSFWQNLYNHSKELFEKLVKVAKGMIDEINKYGSHGKQNTAEWKTMTYVGQETARTLSKEFEKIIASIRSQVAEGKIDTAARIQNAEGETKLSARGVKTEKQLEEYSEDKLLAMELKQAVRNGYLDVKTANVIDAIMEKFPQAWKDHIDVVYSNQEFAVGSKETKGTPYNRADKLTSTTINLKIGELKKDAKNVIVLFKGSNVLDFIHQYGDFIYNRVLTSAQKTVVSKAQKEMGVSTSKVFKQSFFGEMLEKYWLQGNDEANGKKLDKNLDDLFFDAVQSIKSVADRFFTSGDANAIHDNLKQLIGNIIGSGKDYMERLSQFKKMGTDQYYTDEEVVYKFLIPKEMVVDPERLRQMSKEKRWYFQGFSSNAKTGWSYDPSSNCPKKEAFIRYVLDYIDEYNVPLSKLSNDRFYAELYDKAKKSGITVPCEYCYVEEARRKALEYHTQGAKRSGVNFAQGKQLYSNRPYIHEILNFSKKDIAEMNKRGGLRIFSFSDYVRDQHHDLIKMVLEDAAEVGLAIKVITKQTTFVEDFGHYGINIQLSIDSDGKNFAGADWTKESDGSPKISQGVDWDEAFKLSAEYPNVVIRTLAKNREEVAAYLDLENPVNGEKAISVITPYHGDASQFPGYEDMTSGRKTWKQMMDEVRQKQEEDNVKNDDYLATLCCAEGGKCFNLKNNKQCATNCGIKKGNLTIPFKSPLSSLRAINLSKNEDIAGTEVVSKENIVPPDSELAIDTVADHYDMDTKYSAAKKKKEVVKSDVINKAVSILRSKGTAAGDELANALEASDSTYEAKLPKTPGKIIDSKRYIHVSAEDTLNDSEKEKLQKAREILSKSKYKDMNYNLLVIGQKDDYVSFKDVPDFNDVSEPTLYQGVTVKNGNLKYEDGKKTDKETGNEKYQIYHQKATMVKPGYGGFDVEAERKRIEEWKNSGIPEAKNTSKIGWSNYWKEKILDVMKEPDWENKVADRVAKLYESYLGSKDEISKLRPWGDVQQKVTSEDTSINDKKFPKTITSAPFIAAVKDTLGKHGSLTIADIGGGRFDNVKQFFEKGLLNPLLGNDLKKKYREALDPVIKDYRDKIHFHIYDKFNRTETHNAKTTAAIKGGQSDIVTVNNVLNVIDEPAARAQVIINAADAVKPDGTVFILPYVGNQSGVGEYTQEEGSWQTNRVAESYVPEVKRYFDEVNIKDGIIVAKKPKGAVLAGEEELKYSVKSDKFKAWFKDSKVVDENGDPMVVYHGTSNSNFAVFNTMKTPDEPGVHFGTQAAAAEFVDPKRYRRGSSPRVYPVYLSIQNPLETTDLYGDIENVFFGLRKMIQDDKTLPMTKDWREVVSAQRMYQQFRFSKDSTADLRDAIVSYLKNLGYDGLKYVNDKEDEGSVSWVAFDPSQIKSAIGNNGEYANDNPDIRYSSGDKEKERSHHQRYDEADISDPNFLKRIKENTKNYKPITIKGEWDKALPKVQEDIYGYYDKIMNMANFNKASDVAEGEAVMFILQQRAKELKAAGKAREAGRLFDHVARIGEMMDNFFTNAGQIVSMGRLWKALGTDATIKFVRKKINGQRTEEQDQRLKDGVKNAEEEIDRIVQESDTEEEAVKKLKDHLKKSLGFSSKMMGDAYTEETKETKVQNVVNVVEEQRSSNDKSKFDELLERGREVSELFDMIEARNAKKIAQAVAGTAKDLLSALNVNKMKFSVGKSEAVDNVKLMKLIEDHYSKPLSERGDLVKKLVDGLGMSSEQAESLAIKINEKMKDITREEKLKALMGESSKSAVGKAVDKISAFHSGEFTTGKITKEQKGWIERICESAYNGDLDSDELRELFAAKWKIPVFTGWMAAKLEDYTDAIDGLEKGSEDYNAAVNAMNDFLNTIVHHDIWEKLNTVENIMMLSGSKSAARNIFGNLARLGSYNLEEFGKALMDMIKVAPLRLKGGKGGRTFLMPQVGKQLKGLKDGEWAEIKDVWKDRNTRAVEDGKEFASYIKYPKKIVRIGGKEINVSIMNIMQRWVRLLMSDRAFSQAVINDYMARAEKLAKVNGISYDEHEAMQMANEIADETFFNGSDEIINSIVKFRKDANAWIPNKVMHILGHEDYKASGAWGLGSWVLKFAKVPYNVSVFAIEREWHLAATKIFARTVATGFAKAKDRNGGYIQNKRFNVKAFFDDLSKLGNGLLMMYLGGWLWQMGLVHMRPDDDDKDKKLLKLEKLIGHSKYQLNLSAMRRFFLEGKRAKQEELPDDHYATLDWFVPTSILLIAGIKAQELHEKKTKQAGNREMSNLEKMLESVTNGMSGLLVGTMEQVNGVLEMPMLQTLSKLQYAPDSIDKAAMLLMDLPARFVPAPVKYVKDMTDNIQRESYSNVGAKQAINNVIAKLPNLSKDLFPKVNMFGEEIKTYPTGNSLWNIAGNPAMMSRYSDDPVAQNIQKVYDRYGLKDQIPMDVRKSWSIKKADWYIDDDEMPVNLTAREYYNYQVAFGKKVKEIASKMTVYDDDEKAQKAEVAKIHNLYQDAKDEIEKQILKARGLSNKK